MKRSIITLLFVSISLNIWSNGVLKWRLNFVNMNYDNSVYITKLELDVLNRFKVCSDSKKYCNGLGEAMDKGEYNITDPCLLLFQYTDNDLKIHNLIVPGIPNEEVVLTGRPGSTGYDITGSNFYNQFHEVDLFVDGLKEKYKDEKQIFLEYVEYIKSHPDNDACAMMIPLALKNHDNIKEAAKALSPQVKSGNVKKYVDYLINLDEINHSIINLGSFLKVKDYKKINIRGLIIKDDTTLPNKSDMFKLKPVSNSDNNTTTNYEIEGTNSNYMLLKINEGTIEQKTQFIKKDGYSKCIFNTSLYYEGAVPSNSIFNEILFITDKNEAVDYVIENQIDELKKNKITQLDIDNRENSSIKIIGEEKAEYNGREYRAIRYSDGITKIIDLNKNWILFKTEYKKDEYKGEDTNTPIYLFDYISKPAISASIKSGRYRLVLSNQIVTFVNTDNVQCSLKASNDLLKQVSKCYYSYLLWNSDCTVQSCYSQFPNLCGKEYVVRGPNGNVLEDLTKLKFVTLTEPKGHAGGYFDQITNKMYYISRGSDEGRVMQAWSLIKSSTKINSIYDDDILMIDCLSSDTITRFVSTKNVGEIQYSNGDYVKYSKLKNNMIFDCMIHRKDGLFTIKRENDKPVAKYDFTSGNYKGYYYEYKSDYFEPKIGDLLGFADLTVSGLINFSSGYFYNKKTRAKLSNNHGSLYNLETKQYEVLNDQKKQELEAEEKAKQKKQEELQPLYEKYGKKYVDAVMKENKILIGTPEGLISNHMNSSLKRDGQNTRTYEITGITGKWAATVYVDKKTKKVTSVSYR